MHIHEYQAKQLFRDYHIPTPVGKEVLCPKDLEPSLREFGNRPMVIKAQIHAGGRGKAGGVLLASDSRETLAAAKQLFGKTLYTKQTGSEGKLVRKLYIEQQTKIRKEFYLSLLIDPSSGQPTFIASSEGGMEIEEVAEKHPEKICTLTIDPAVGFKPYHGHFIANQIGVPSPQKKEFLTLLANMYRLFWEKDCSMIEINPLVQTDTQSLIALDAKIELDNSAFFRHPENAALRDRGEEPALEAAATDSDMNYVALHGNIGCLVIGAGLGMSTMDAVQYFGGKPANFMDCGGSVTVEKSKKAFEIVASGKGVEGILVNIFGGITRTDLIAEGILAALKEQKKQLPLVVRLEGTGSREANRLLKTSGFKLELTDSLSEGTRKIISLIQENHGFADSSR